MNNKTPPAWAIQAMKKLKLLALADPFANVDLGASIIADHSPDADALADALETIANCFGDGGYKMNHAHLSLSEIGELAKKSLTAYRAAHPKQERAA